MNKHNNSTTGLSFTSALLLIFVVLKLCGVISWSWLWVLSPIWIPLALCAILVTIYWLIEFYNKRH